MFIITFITAQWQRIRKWRKRTWQSDKGSNFSEIEKASHKRSLAKCSVFTANHPMYACTVWIWNPHPKTWTDKRNGSHAGSWHENVNCAKHWQLFWTHAHILRIRRLYGLTIEDNDGKICFSFDSAITKPHSTFNDCLKTWLRQKNKLDQWKITKEQYDEWRYKYPALETLQQK